MQITTVFDFTIPLDYIYDNTKIEVVGGLAQLINVPPYDMGNPTIRQSIGIDTDGLISISPTVNVASGNDIKYTIEIDGKEKYFDGFGCWIDTDGTFETTNTIDVINENLDSLDINNGSNIKVVIWFYSSDGLSTSQISNLEIITSFYQPPYPIPNHCLVYGYLYDAGNNPLKNTSVKARVSTPDFDTVENIYFINTPIETQTNDNGYFEINLIWSSQFRSAPQYYNFSIRTDGSNESTSRTNLIIPDLITEKFDNLVIAP